VGCTTRTGFEFKNGKARLSLMIPKAAKRKLLKLNLTIRWSGQSAKKLSVFRVH
jgi:hypothetical protein